MSWIAVAKKEYLENVRNAWVITVSVAFLLLVLLTSWVMTAFNEATSGVGLGRDSYLALVDSIRIIQSFGGFFLPILALTLGFGTLAGERESGSLGLLAAQPLSRGEIVGGKWVGLFGVLATAILVGFGIGGLIVLARAGAGMLGYQLLLLFLLETLAWGAAWISVTLLLSAFFNRRGTAIAGSIGLWFLFGSLVWGILTLMVAGLAVGGEFERLQDPPQWLIVTQVLNPNQVYEGLLVTTIEGYGQGSLVGMVASQVLEGAYTPYTFSLAMASWIALPFLGAHALFHRKDI